MSVYVDLIDLWWIVPLLVMTTGALVYVLDKVIGKGFTDEVNS